VPKSAASYGGAAGKRWRAAKRRRRLPCCRNAVGATPCGRPSATAQRPAWSSHPGRHGGLPPQTGRRGNGRCVRHHCASSLCIPCRPDVPCHPIPAAPSYGRTVCESSAEPSYYPRSASRVASSRPEDLAMGQSRENCHRRTKRATPPSPSCRLTLPHAGGTPGGSDDACNRG
jgi:hypothetical protein